MKIAFITIMYYQPWGGSEFLWAETAKAARKQGHEVMISIFAWSKDHPVIKELADMGVQLHLRKNSILPKRFYTPARIIAGELIRRKLFFFSYKGIKKFDPDVICVSQGGSLDLSFDSVQRLLLEWQKPYYVVCQSNFEHKVAEFRYLPVLRDIYARAKKVFFVAARNKEVLERQICMRLPHGEVVSNPLNLQNRDCLAFPAFDNGTVRFASVARLHCNAKGHDVLIQALSSEVWKNRNWELNFYGEGKHEAWLKFLCEQFGVQDKIHFRGHVQDIAAVWQYNHIHIMPSLMEGTPLALIESMACGRPSIVTDVGGNAEYCIEEENGFLAEAPNVKYLSAALERAWQQKENWQQMGLKAHEHYLQYADPTPGKSLLKLILQP